MTDVTCNSYAMNGSELLTTQDVVDLTGKSVATICRWAESGKLSPVHKGRGLTGAYLFTRASVEALTLGTSEN